MKYKALLMALLMLTSAWADIEKLNPERFVNLELAVRSLTIQELGQMRSGDGDSTDYGQLVTDKFSEYGVTASEHARYANDYRGEIDQWLSEHEDKRMQLEQLGAEFDQLIQAAE